MTSTSRLYEVSGSGLDLGPPDSLDVRFTDDPSLPSCLPNMLRPFSESVVVFSESHDVNDMQLQVALVDPNGPRAPLRSIFDDAEGWDIAWTLLLVAPGSCPLSAVEYVCTAGKETATSRICGTTFPRYKVTLSDLNSCQNSSLDVLTFQLGYLPREQSVNKEDSNDVSGPCAPSESKRSASSAGSCGAKLFQVRAGALSDMQDRAPVSSVDGTRAYSVVCERRAVSSGFGGGRILVNSSKSSGGSW